MNKSMKRLCALTLGALTTLATVLPAVGCKEENGGGGTEDSYEKVYRNTEKDALTFSIAQLDGNFNPFFATSATDVTIAGQTQISMMTTDKVGNPKCGEDVPTVALNYKETRKSDTTEYEFLIKNGIQFSDGEPLTIKDVLFNLYVYLDPAYMGSATIYSTKIQGLNAYRLQEPSATDDQSVGDAEATFDTQAYTRITALSNYLEGEGEETPQITKDLKELKKLFKKEVESDWNINAGALESYKEQYTFTEDWQVFLFAEGFVTVQTEVNDNGNYVARKDENGKYITNLDPDKDGIVQVSYAQDIADALTETAIQAKMDEMDCDEATAKEYIKKETAINLVYNAYEPHDSKMFEVLNWWQSGIDLRDKIAGEIRENWFNEKKETAGGELLVKSVSGITTYKAASGETFAGKMGNTELKESHDVLKIVINGVDPKAIWNFSFSVAPMHYYSNAEQTAKANGVDSFGVEFASQTFFDEVLQADSKNRLPVGAGTYMASDREDSDNVEGDDFYKNNWVFYKRNPYFETTDGRNGTESTAIHNANIKYMRYKVVGSDKILNALISEDIDVGEPSATQDNINKIGEYDHLGSKKYWTNGYGYVGVNPKYVPDIEVRQAIMKAMDTALIVKNYYTTSLAKTIHRSMSTQSWAYPTDSEGNAVKQHEKVAFTRIEKEITDLVESAGYTRANTQEVYAKDGQRLKFTFTIAGETTDHPAYSMFQDAATFLNEKCGFEITVTTDISALKKLATGDLQVWAAAWSSSIDPDLYQVYHKDSTATSVKNWGYPTIMNGSDSQFAEEKQIIDDLSLLIEQGRETLNQEERKATYAQALDKIMELCVELPTYQRQDLVVYNRSVIDPKTLNEEPSSTSGVFDRLWEVNYYKA
jgi:peptide/nickel transport system substrate-binding protein